MKVQDVECIICGKHYQKSIYYKTKNVCSVECRGRLRFQEKNKERRDLFDSGKLTYRKRLRYFLIERDGYKCQICNQKEWNNQSIPLQVDHIDGNASNNTSDNLRLICHNCDALLPTFAGRNRGKGRLSRGLRVYD